MVTALLGAKAGVDMQSKVSADGGWGMVGWRAGCVRKEVKCVSDVLVRETWGDGQRGERVGTRGHGRGFCKSAGQRIVAVGLTALYFSQTSINSSFASPVDSILALIGPADTPARVVAAEGAARG